MTKLRIASDFNLPIDTATQTLAILAVRGMGKTFLSKVLAEEMLKVGIPIVISDPIGVYWGLRSSESGKQSGYPIIIFGGDHADVPLEVTAGETVADFIIGERVPAILDLSLFRKGEQIRFMTDFCERLYHKNRNALHLFMDEADSFSPQKPMKGAERLLGAVEDLVRRGRARGIGVTLITQRAAVLNKNVLTQISMLIALRTVSPQDRRAIDEWIEVHGTEEEREELMMSLPSLPVGTAWFWSPGWLKIFKKVKVRTIETFDSSKTPTVGEKITLPKKLADIDLNKIKGKIAETIERVKSDNPKELKKRIVELQRQLDSKPNIEASGKIKEQISELTASLKISHSVIKKLRSRLEKIVVLGSVDDEVFREADEIEAQIPKLSTVNPVVASNSIRVRNTAGTNFIKVDSGETKLPSGERKILIVLAQHPGGRKKNQIGIIAGYAHKGGSFNNYLSSLRTKGYIEGRGEDIRITELGINSLGDYEELPQGSELLSHWLSKLGKAERSILAVLKRLYPRSLSKVEIAESSGYEAGGGSFNNALSKLRTLNLIEGRGEIKLSDNLV